MSVLGLKGRTVPPADSRVEFGHLSGFQLADTDAVVGESEPAPDDERNSELTDRRREPGYLE